MSKENIIEDELRIVDVWSDKDPLLDEYLLEFGATIILEADD